MIANVTRTACRVGILVLLTMLVYPNADAQPAKPCPENEFLAKYYKNESAVGLPAFTRCEKRIDFDWGERGPSGPVRGSSSSAMDSGKADGGSTLTSLGKEHFSVRWAGRFNFEGGDYTFLVTADDGILVKVDDQVIIDEWRLQAATEFRATRNLTPGIHRVSVAYYQNVGGAVARVRWQK